MSEKVKEITIAISNKKNDFPYVAWSIIGLKLIIISYLGYFLTTGYQNSEVHFGTTFLFFILAGFVAQMVDGALGMAYGVSCTSLWLVLGVPPKLASASVHTTEIFTTGVSGLSHIRFKNIDKSLFCKIVITGVMGASIGAYLLSSIFDGDFIKPYISIYLLGLGIYIFSKASKKQGGSRPKTKSASVLSFFGGLLDAVGVGGWGPIVTSNLLGQGHSPRHT